MKFTFFALMVSLVAHSSAIAGPLFGVSGAGGVSSSLYTIDPTTGASTLIGATGFSEVVSIDFNPTTGVLYGISNDGGTLITIDTTTGVGTAVPGAATIGFNSPDIGFNSAGVLYGWSEASPDRLNTIDIVTGATTEIGPNTLSTYQTGLDVDSADIIFLKDGDGEIYTIDPTTGAATLVASLGSSIFDNVLAFDSSDTPFTIDRSGGDSFLYTIDLGAETTTLVGATGIDRLAALAFQPDANVVPEPTSLALLATGALGFMGYGWRRKRNQAA